MPHSEQADPYSVDTNWPIWPNNWEVGDVADVAVTEQNTAIAFLRTPQPMIAVLDIYSGHVVATWGQGAFMHPHALRLAPDKTLYCTDDGDHTVRRFTLDGGLLQVFGTPGKPSPFMSGRPFNRCTQAAIAPNGDVWIADGYGNGQVHRFTEEGAFITSIGKPGAGPGEFNLPHDIETDEEGNLLVVDRENHRIQIFTDEGAYVDEWRNLHRPSCLQIASDGGWIVGEIGPVLSSNRGAPNLGPRLSFLDNSGTLVGRFGSDGPGLKPHQFLSPHGLAIDGEGAIYVADVGKTAWPQLFPEESRPSRLIGLKKLVPVP